MTAVITFSSFLGGVYPQLSSGGRISPSDYVDEPYNYTVIDHGSFAFAWHVCNQSNVDLAAVEGHFMQINKDIWAGREIDVNHSNERSRRLISIRSFAGLLRNWQLR